MAKPGLFGEISEVAVGLVCVSLGGVLVHLVETTGDAVELCRASSSLFGGASRSPIHQIRKRKVEWLDGLPPRIRASERSGPRLSVVPDTCSGYTLSIDARFRFRGRSTTGCMVK